MDAGWPDCPAARAAATTSGGRGAGPHAGGQGEEERMNDEGEPTSKEGTSELGKR